MNPWLQALISNIAIASLLAVVAAVAPRRGASPALTYSLWLLVLIKLVTPPIWRLPVDSSLLIAESGAEQLENAVRRGPTSAPSEMGPASASDEDRLRWDLATVGAELQALALELALELEPEGFSETETVAQSSAIEFQPVRAEVAAPERSIVEEDAGASWAWPRVNLRDVVLTVWASVAAILGLLAVSRIYRFRKRVFERAVISDVLTDEARQVAREMALRTDPVVYVVNASIPPALWPGLRRATLVCPMTLLGEMSESERAGLFAHELAHYARRDTWRRYFEAAVVTLYWWFPIAWVARHNLQRLEERLCDSWALDRAKRPAADYAQALLKTMNFLSRGTTATPSTACGFGDKNRKTTMYRFKAILTDRENAKLSLKQWAAVLAIAGLTAPISGVSPVSRAQEPNEGGSNAAVDVTEIPAEEPTTAGSQASDAEPLGEPSADPFQEPIGTDLEAVEPEDPFDPPSEPVPPGIPEAPEPSADPFEEPNDLFGAASDVSVEQTQSKQQARIRRLEARLVETQARLETLTRETEDRLMLRERELAATLDQMLAQLGQALMEQAQKVQDLPPPETPPLENAAVWSLEVATEKHEIESRLAEVTEQLQRVQSERGENNPQAQSLRQERLALEQARAALEQRWAEMEQARLKAYADQARAQWQDQLERRENPPETMSDEEREEELLEEFRKKHPKPNATEIEKILREVRIDELSYTESPLSEVIRELSKTVREADKETRGVNFMITSRIEHDASFKAERGFSFVPSPFEEYPRDLRGVTVTIDPPISETSAYDALRVIMKVADSPIFFSIEDYGVVIRPGEDPKLKRYTRTYKLDPEVFEAALEDFDDAQSEGPEALSLQDAVRQFFAKFGLSLLPPNDIFYNNRNGTLLIRATAEELQEAESAIRVLNEITNEEPADSAAVQPETTATDDAAYEVPELSVNQNVNLTPGFYRIHRALPGESLMSIAVGYNVNMSELAKLNGIEDSRDLKVGQILDIPVQVPTQSPVQVPVIPAADEAVSSLSLVGLDPGASNNETRGASPNDSDLNHSAASPDRASEDSSGSVIRPAAVRKEEIQQLNHEARVDSTNSNSMPLVPILVARKSFDVIAPGAGRQQYKTIDVDASSLGGRDTLHVQLVVGDGESAVSMDVFDGIVDIPKDPVAQETLRQSRSVQHLYDIPSGKKREIAFKIMPDQQLTIGVTGSCTSWEDSENTVTVSVIATKPLEIPVAGIDAVEVEAAGDTELQEPSDGRSRAVDVSAARVPLSGHVEPSLNPFTGLIEGVGGVDAFQVEEASLIRSVEVEIGRDGGLSLGRRSVDLNELRSELNRLNEAGYRGLKVIVAASPSTRLDQMTSVFATCQDLGIPFEIRAKDEPEATEGPGDNEARSE